MRILLMDRELRSQCRSQDKGKVKSVFDDMDPLKTHSKRIVILHPKVPFLRAFLPVTQPCLRVSFSRAQVLPSPSERYSSYELFFVIFIRARVGLPSSLFPSFL
jgi:hypothetical protein